MNISRLVIHVTLIYAAISPIAQADIVLRGSDELLIDLSTYDQYWEMSALESSQQSQWVVAALAGEQLLWQKVLSTSNTLRAEIFDPNSGAIESSQDLQQNKSLFTIKLAPDLIYSNINLYLLESEQVQLIDSKRSIDNGNFKTNNKLADGSTSLLKKISALEVAATLSTVMDNGPSSNRIDMVILGDGYTWEEMDQWHRDVDASIAAFFNEPPFSGYREYFNVHRIDVLSEESGVSHLEIGSVKNSALGSYYNCSGIARLICVDETSVRAVVNTLLGFDQQDLIIVIVNDDEYGGSGGSIAVASKNSFSTELLLHEVGHSFGLLADEYDYLGVDEDPACIIPTFELESNISQGVNVRTNKWSHWIAANTPIPTPSPAVITSDVGIYSGARYCQNLYRPTPDSKMRSLGRPYDAVNEEALILRLYHFVQGIDGYSPLNKTVALSPGQTQEFSVDMLQANYHELILQWYVDDELVQVGGALSSIAIDQGEHRIKAVVSDPTAKVRRDDSQVLVSQHTWLLTKSFQTNAIEVSEGARVEDDRLIIPYIRVKADNSLYRLELSIVLGSSVTFDLLSLTQLEASLVRENESFFIDNTLNLQHVAVGDTLYNIQLAVVSNVASKAAADGTADEVAPFLTLLSYQQLP